MQRILTVSIQTILVKPSLARGEPQASGYGCMRVPSSWLPMRDVGLSRHDPEDHR